MAGEMSARAFLESIHWPRGSIDTALGVIFAESGGVIEKDSPPNKDGSIDRGLFQINNKAHPTVTDKCAHNAECNARAALVISRGGTDWSAWSTCNRTRGCTAGAAAAAKGRDFNITGSKDAPGRAGDPISKVAGGAADAVTSTAGALGDLVTVLEKFVEGLFSSAVWFRVGKVLVGLFLGGLGLVIITRKAGGGNLPVPIPV